MEIINGRKNKRGINKHGFTLIELLTVISIIGILASIAAPSFHKSVIRARETSLKRTLFVLRDVIDQYYGDHGQYPDDLAVLVDDRYIREIPEDPFTRTRDSWILMLPEGEATGGVWDVHSGSDRVSIGGKPYNEW